MRCDLDDTTGVLVTHPSELRQQFPRCQAERLGRAGTGGAGGVQHVDVDRDVQVERTVQSLRDRPIKDDGLRFDGGELVDVVHAFLGRGDDGIAPRTGDSRLFLGSGLAVRCRGAQCRGHGREIHRAQVGHCPAGERHAGRVDENIYAGVIGCDAREQAAVG